MRNGFSPWIRAPGGDCLMKKYQVSKISRHFPFKAITYEMLFAIRKIVYKFFTKNVLDERIIKENDRFWDPEGKPKQATETFPNIIFQA
jgi:hypothetical protein